MSLLAKTRRQSAALLLGISVCGFSSIPVAAEPVIHALQWTDTQTHIDADAGFSFQVESSVGVEPEGIDLIVNGISRASDLVIDGSASYWFVSYAGLFPNRIYDARIEITDIDGDFVSQRVRFDTLQAENFVIEAQHSNFDGGQFIDNPPYDDWFTPNYRGVVGVQNVDHLWTATGGLREYRVNDTIATYNITRYDANQPLRPHLSNQWFDEFAISNMARPSWLNYTRTFPEGKYFVYGRAAALGVIDVRLDRVLSDPSQENQETELLGTFSLLEGTGGWQTYQTVPLTDDEGNPVIIELNGIDTLRLSFLTTATNFNFFTLVSAENSPPVLSGINPGDRAMQHDSQEGLTFSVSSEAGVDSSGVVLFLNGEERTEDLVLTGDEMLWNVRFDGLEMNRIYDADIFVTDDLGQEVVRSLRFDTYSRSNFTFEAEDWNFDGGNFIDNPSIAEGAPGSYRETVGIQDIDKNVTNGNGNRHYRVNENKGTAAWSVVNPDGVRRPRYISEGVDEYNVGWMAAGEWFNYTRTFPSGSYYIYGFMAAATGPIENFLDRVVSDPSQPGQEVEPLGVFSYPATGGWQVYDYVPLVDENGEPVVVTLNGEETLRLTVGSGQANINFFMLLPAGEQPETELSKLNIERGPGGAVVLSWEGDGQVLEASTDLTEWEEVADTSPFEEETGNFDRRFYRLRLE